MQRNEFIDQVNKNKSHLLFFKIALPVYWTIFYRNSVFLSPSNNEALTFYKYNR